MANIINAIINLISNPDTSIRKEYINSKNRANSMGVALEEYLKDLFANTLSIDKKERIIIHNKIFSYMGNQNNPPDFILRGGDAVEVKKIESHHGSISLNSSYPKHKLFRDSPMLTNSCKTCEEWEEKDIVYAIGEVDKTSDRLSSLSLVYGEDYAASQDIYENIRLKIKEGLLTIPSIEFQETKELGRVNRVDPLGITYLRIRGMWGIKKPFRVFDYILPELSQDKFVMMAIINEEKWNTFDNKDELKELILKTSNAKLEKVLIKLPNNPAQLRSAYLVYFEN